jgi:hypothetical protein
MSRGKKESKNSLKFDQSSSYCMSQEISRTSDQKGVRFFINSKKKRDTQTDLTLFKFFLFTLFYDVSEHVCCTPYCSSTRWKETKHKLDIEHPLLVYQATNVCLFNCH